MKTWQQFLETKTSESGETQAVMTLVHAIKAAFKKLSRIRRKKAWDSITSPKGKEEIRLLINNPDRPVSRYRLLRGAGRQEKD